ncbi:MAG: hypothetical protein JNL08_16530 [Planctomycetes bacterium]|nr:hypothetical protein [Planctomycetota bacterium]
MRASRPTLCLCLLGAACQGFAPPTAEVLQRVRPMPCAARVPARFELELESPALTGVFDGVSAVGPQRFALQLFPDVGGKVFDLVVTADRIAATTPAGDYVATAPLDGAPPHLALVLAAVFAELLAPVPPARVLGERQCDGVVQLRLAPALGSGEVVAELAADGTIAAYRIALGRLAVTLRADGTVTGSGCRAALRWPDDG